MDISVGYSTQSIFYSALPMEPWDRKISPSFNHPNNLEKSIKMCSHDWPWLSYNF